MAVSSCWLNTACTDAGSLASADLNFASSSTSFVVDPTAEPTAPNDRPIWPSVAKFPVRLLPALEMMERRLDCTAARLESPTSEPDVLVSLPLFLVAALMASIRPLYSATKFFTAVTALAVSWLTVTFAGVVVVALNVSVLPFTVTVFESEYCVAPPSTAYCAFVPIVCAAARRPVFARKSPPPLSARVMVSEPVFVWVSLIVSVWPS